ncbi:hypothetical protein HDV00_006077 [Rhizophlyctis rosea]|nr:hypothetical protein HDV00_006077 [Rhizophlyctis rosea]
MILNRALAILAAIAVSVNAQGCTRPAPLYPLHTHKGWAASVLLRNVNVPRGLEVDSHNNLLAVLSGAGVTAYTVNEHGCVTKTKQVITESTLNHAIALSVDGRTLFVSSTAHVWKYDYDPSTATASNRQIIVNVESQIGHITRSLLNLKHHPHVLVVTVGSQGDLDFPSFQPTSGRADARLFDLRHIPSDGYAYTSGQLLGYGLRNEVGIAEDRKGTLWGVENSSDEIYRQVGDTKYDVSNINPGEKLNKLGNPSDLRHRRAGWYGYPYCFTVYDPQPFPHDRSYKRGDQFVESPGKTVAGVLTTDSLCNNVTKPTQVFPAHNAPLDLKFSPHDTNAYVALHGSNPLHRNPGSGYKVVYLPGHYRHGADSWEPNVRLPSTRKAYVDLLFNADEKKCHGFVSPSPCFRPVAMAWDRLHPKRLYVSSDGTNEIFVVTFTGKCSDKGGHHRG